ncbi:MAG: membrane lipoprotein lipid attachment site-containing protein [Tannerellaceae bacterium]|jgi:hypothetical protein|nr:membrane lipoprotein lipid attachment site-containing protein [Tannerellaceae bacterium]
MKRIIFILFCLAAILSACSKDEGKQTQSINFGEIAPQLLRNASITLQATASSGLPVFFSSWDTETAAIEGDRLVFKQAGKVDIVAYQPGNEQYYEAPEITRQLLIRDWDPEKKVQTIDFELPDEWKISRDGQTIRLNAVSSSGLPVTYTLENTVYGRLLDNVLYVYHAGESSAPGDKIYDVQISVIASQGGNNEYNPADNITKTVHVIGDVFH